MIMKFYEGGTLQEMMDIFHSFNFLQIKEMAAGVLSGLDQYYRLRSNSTQHSNQ